jgi:Rhomboid-like protein
VTAEHMRNRYGFAGAYLACFVVAELVYARLSPDAQARLVAWASTDVANLAHEPAGPLLISAFITPGYLLTWPVLIALALFGANRALGNVRTALVCLAGHVVGSLVSEGIVAYRVDAGQLPGTDRYLTDVGPSYVVVSAIVIAVLCGGWLARVLAVADFALLVFVGHIFDGLSQLDVPAVGHLTAMLTATAATVFVMTRWRPGPGSAGHVAAADGHADQVGDPGGERPEEQLPYRAPPEGPVGQPGHHAPADDRGDGGQA